MANVDASPERVKYDMGFSREVYGLENGSHIKQCMQCGVCAVSCATFKFMDYSPRRLFGLIRAGCREQVMKSNTIWMCTSCLMCKVRCPRGIPIIDVMHDLKGFALRQGYTDYPQATVYQAFWKDLSSRGRMFIGSVIAYYVLKRGIYELGKNVSQKDVALKLLTHGRLPIAPPKAPKGKEKLMQMIKRAQELNQKGAK